MGQLRELMGTAPLSSVRKATALGKRPYSRSLSGKPKAPKDDSSVSGVEGLFTPSLVVPAAAAGAPGGTAEDVRLVTPVTVAATNSGKKKSHLLDLLKGKQTKSVVIDRITNKIRVYSVETGAADHDTPPVESASPDTAPALQKPPPPPSRVVERVDAPQSLGNTKFKMFIIIS